MNLAKTIEKGMTNQAEPVHPFLRSRQIRLQRDNGRAILEGDVDSYYEKQVAQELAKQLDGIDEIINRITVDWGR